MTIESTEKERMIKVMTKEIAIHNLFALKLRSRVTSDREALDLAIKALEQQPCDDCISREDVLALAEKGILVSNGNYKSVCKAINDLPSVTPKGVTITDFADKCRECGRIKPCEDVLEKIKAEILDEAEYAYADFDRYKEDILHAEPDELPDDDFRYGLERAVEIIDKYKAESEE